MVRHRQSEIDEQLVPVVRHGAALGLPMPLTRLVVERIHALERAEIAPSWQHLDDLARLL
jgi:ketopantoate reductase